MEKKLSWFDRAFTPKTKAYKNFEKEIKNTAPEIFFRDGERKFSDKEKKFIQVYKSKEKQLIIGSAFTVNITFNANPEISVKNNFKNLTEVIPFIERQKTNNSVLIIQNNTALTEITIASESSKQKFISDSWAKELENRTDLSFGLNTTQIDERQSHHYRLYELENKKEFAEELNTNYDRNLVSMWDFSTEQGLKVLDLAIEMRDFPEELTDSIIEYTSLKPPYFPERYDFVDDSYDRGESDYERAMERYEVNALKYSEEVQYYKDFFYKYNFNSDRIYALNFSEYDPESLSILVQDLKDKKDIVGKITFYESGEEMSYFSPENYLNALRNELDTNMGGFKYETLMKTPELVKKVDDLIYDTYGDVNPNSLDYYIEKLESTKAEIGDIVNEEFQNSTQKISKKIKELERDRDFELLADNFSAAKEIEHKIIALEKQIKNFNNQNPNIMETQKEFDQVKYLKDQLKYLGFGEDEKIHKDLENGINSNKQEFTIKTTSDKTLPENKIDFTLNYNRSEKGGIFLNSYDANLTNEKAESIVQNFRVSRDSSFTVKETINLLEGRSVKIEFDNPKSNERESAFVKLNFGEDKNRWGNYNFQNFYKNYGVDTTSIVEKSNLVFDNPEWKEGVIKSLEKGNIVKVKFKDNDQVIDGKAVLDPQNRNLKLYDNEMNRLNTNKPLEGLEQDNKHEKSNVREQSIKR